MFNLDGSIVRFYHLLLIFLSLQLTTLAHSSAELSDSVYLTPESLSKYITHSSVLAENWRMDEGGGSLLVPGGAHQQYGNSAFQISPAFDNSKLTLIFFTFFASLDLSACNFYVLADQRNVNMPSPKSNFIFYTFDLSIPKNTKIIEIGILPPPDKSFTCNLKLYSIAIEERSENNDLDDDGITGDKDNCPTTKNPDQLDSDFDGIGDICTFDRTKYFSSSIPTECESSSTIGPDNDADGISDLCDPDDDNDTIKDVDELHWGMDVFTAFDFDFEKDTDHDKDGLLSTDEIELGYSPFIPNFPPTVKLNKYVLNHKNRSTTLSAGSNLIYQYASKDNQSFSFGSRHPNYHYELNEGLLLTGASLIDGSRHDFKHDFQPKIRVFPSPVLINHEYKTVIDVNLIYSNNLTGETDSTLAVAKVIAKVALSDDKEKLSFNYLLEISNKETSEVMIRRLNEPTVLNATEGFIGIGELDDYTSLIPYIPPEPNESSSSNKSGGAFHFVFLLTLLGILSFPYLSKSYLYAIKHKFLN